MKKNLIFFAAIGIIVASAAACSKEISDPSTEVKTAMVPCCIQASTGEVTKTHIKDTSDKKANIVWDEGDNISVFSTNVSGAGNNQFTISDISGTSATFSGEVEEGTTDLVAVYPYSSGLSYSGGTISGAAIPTIQSATADSFVNGASIALAKGTKTVGDPTVSALSFSNLCAVIGFTLPSNITFADQVVITAKSGANIAGNVSINASTPAITSADAASVTVNGSFEGGNTYYICIAPGSYTDGFNFAISTKGGNSYTRSTSKTLPAAAGGLYVLGKLSLALPDDSFTPSVSVTHNVSNGTLNGSTATFSMTSNVPDEFDGAIKSVLTNVTVWKGSKTYRSCGTSGKSVESTEMTISSGCPYVPSGCSYTATIMYTINNGEKDVARTITKTGTVTWSAPSGMAIDATLAGYTSYDTYLSSGASSANSLDGSTVYGVGASYKSGLSSDVKTQSDSEGLLTFTSTLDGSDASGNQGSKSWASHKIGAKWSFDNGNASGTCASTKTVNVTGLPVYVKDAALNTLKKAGWSTQGTVQTYDDYLCTFLHTWGGSDKGAMVTPKFNLPATTNVSCYVKHMNYAAGVGKDQTAYIGPVSSTTSTTTAYSMTVEYTAGSSTQSGTLNFSLSSSTPYVYFGVKGDYKTMPSVTTYYLIDINITYR